MESMQIGTRDEGALMCDPEVLDGSKSIGKDNPLVDPLISYVVAQ